jgi:Ger(x)C family germination protein
MRKIITAGLLCVLLALLLTSCYDAKEIDEQSNVLTIGLDEGISNKWRLTLQIPTMQGESGGSMGGGQGDPEKKTGQQFGYTAVSIDAPSFFEGINMLESSIPRQLNFEHMKYIVISEEMARSGQLGDFMAPIRRFRQIRNSSHVIISRGSAEEFVNDLQPFIGTRLSKSQELYFLEPSKSGFFPHVTLEDLYDGFKSTYRQPIAVLGGVNDFKSYQEEGEKWGGGFKSGGEYLAGQLPRKAESSIEFFGTAIFDGGQMVGELNGDETRFMMLGAGTFKRGFFSIPDPESPGLLISLSINETNRKVRVRFEKDKPVIHLELQLEGDILSIQSRNHYESPQLKPVLEKASEQYIKKELDKLIKRTKALKADIFQFGRIAVWQFGTIQDWEKYNWIAQYENAEVTTEVRFTITNTGTMLSSSPLITTEGKK